MGRGEKGCSGPRRKEEASDKRTPVSTRNLFGFHAFYILGFQIRFLLNKSSEFESQWLRHHKRNTDLWKWLLLTCREDIFLAK